MRSSATSPSSASTRARRSPSPNVGRGSARARGSRRDVGARCRRHRLVCPDLVAEEVREPLLLLTRPASEAHDQLALAQPVQDVVHLVEGREGVQPLAALLQLARGLGAAQHQHREHRDLALSEIERLGEELPVLDGAASRSAREPGPAQAAQLLRRDVHRALVVGDDRVAIGRLVAGEAERVEGERILVGRGALLLEQAAEHPDLDGVSAHPNEAYAAAQGAGDGFTL